MARFVFAAAVLFTIFIMLSGCGTSQPPGGDLWLMVRTL